ncbi:MAG: aspartyl protease family protein [Fimbriimonadaceae bacterium]|nr:aspartyl protease family protein [Chitinophagales bacterium]
MNIKLKIQKIPPGGSHIFVKGKIGGKKVTYLIDTGASKSVIDKTYVEKHFSELHVVESKHSTTGLGATYDKSSFITIPNIQIGDFIIPKKEFGLLDLSMINTAYQQAGLDPIIVIIGGDILLKYKGIIDYKNKLIKLYSK